MPAGGGPHFEKMLYDQALLCLAYTEAFQITGQAFYRRVAEKTFAYIIRELRAPEGVFTPPRMRRAGEEGKYYLWTRRRSWIPWAKRPVKNFVAGTT